MSDDQTLWIYTANALLNEMDRYTGTTMGGLPVEVSSSSGLDRDFYARTLAADLDSSSKRLKKALKTVTKRVRKSKTRVATEDQRQYAAAVAGVDPSDDAAAIAAYREGWLAMAENLVTRGLNLIDATEGPIQQPDALVELGLMDPEPTTPAPVDLKQIAENVHRLLERLEADPGRDWAPSEAIDLEQIDSLIAHDSWEPVLVSAAESARTILAASPWPQQLVEGEMPLEVTHDMVMGFQVVDLPEGTERAAKVIMNRALASSDPIVDVPELEPFDPEGQGQVWIALMVWFALKCGAIEDVVRREMGR